MNLLKKATQVCRYVVNFRVDQWVDLPYQKKTALYAWRMVKQLFLFKQANPAASPEAFANAVNRLAVTPESLDRRAQSYWRISVFFLAFSMVLLGYALSLWGAHNPTAAVITVTLSILSMSFAFRYHFWYFQITQKTLGCSITAWKQFFITSVKHCVFHRVS